eukprot:12905023-Heterocapsa_arctica.AAC.1
MAPKLDGIRSTGPPAARHPLTLPPTPSFNPTWHVRYIEIAELALRRLASKANAPRVLFSGRARIDELVP